MDQIERGKLSVHVDTTDITKEVDKLDSVLIRSVIFLALYMLLEGGIDITKTPLSETPELALLILGAAVIGGVVSAIFLRRLPRLVAGIIGFVAGIYMLLLVFELYAVTMHDVLEALFAILPART